MKFSEILKELEDGKTVFYKFGERCKRNYKMFDINGKKIIARWWDNDVSDIEFDSSIVLDFDNKFEVVS